VPQLPKFDPVRPRGLGPVRLPAGGRQGPPPPWPLADDPSPEEWVAWGQLWGTPQAAAWERMGLTRIVGRFCRVMLAAEEHDASPAILAQAVALEDNLGLTPRALRRLLWEVVDDEVPPPQGARRTTARDRMRAVSRAAR